MSMVNLNPSVTAASGWAANMSPKHDASAGIKTPEPQLQTANDVSDVSNNGAVINVLDEMVLDIDSYQEKLDEHLEALAKAMSNLEQGVARRKAIADETAQADSPSAAQKHKNPFKQIYEELFRELSMHGHRKMVDIQGNLVPEKAVALLKD